jgi:hypothetical protein
MEIKLPEDFKEFLKLLTSHQVEYLLIGGFAVTYYGYPRATNDMDVWVAVHPDNATRLVEAMREFGFTVPELTPELFLQEQKIIRMGFPPVRIEILTSISGVKFTDCYAHRNMQNIDGIVVSLISLEHLKENKRASARFKDLDDLENLP